MSRTRGTPAREASHMEPRAGANRDCSGQSVERHGNAINATISAARSDGQATATDMPRSQAHGKNGTDWTYTKLPHSIIDNPHARALSPGAFRVLFDFLRVWTLKTRNGQRRCDGVTFAWSRCRWPVCEDTWNNHRRELVEHGFIECVSKRAGVYRWSECYKKLSMEQEHVARLEKHEARLNKQKERVRAFRARATTVPGFSRDGSNPKDPGTGVPGGSWDTRPQRIRVIPLHSLPEHGVPVGEDESSTHPYLLEGWFHAL